MAEPGPQGIGLLPDFRVTLQEIDQVASGNAQRLGRIAYAPFNRLEHIESDAHDGPKAWIFPPQIESAIGPPGVAIIFVVGQASGREIVSGEFIAELQKQGLTQPT